MLDRMKNPFPRRTIGAALAAALAVQPAFAADDAFKLFEEEAQVISASFRPQSLGHTPATVYVVTAEDIKASGARTLWDALRAVPGVDVIETRAMQAEVGIRGLDRTINNRVLVLLDGRTVLDTIFDFITWENIPVTMEEIDRIEIVEGPASALYGANAVSGVINIITKTPEQMHGGLATVSGGGAAARFGSALYGGRTEKADYKLAMGESSVNRFENEGLLASRSAKLHALAGYDFANDQRASVSGGLTKAYTQTTAGGVGTANEHGFSGFLRGDYRWRDTKLRVFWNAGRGVYDDFSSLQKPELHYDTLDANLQQSLSLPADNDLVVGAGYRRNTAASKVFGNASPEQDLWSLFGEDQWKPAEHWTVVASGRFDRHPLTPLSFSSHGSVLWDFAPRQTLRLTAGTSFRNPTLLENYIQFTQGLPNPGTPPLTNPPFSTLNVTTMGNRKLDPERMFQVELSHEARFGPVKTVVAGYYYRLRNLILSANPALVSAVPPNVDLQNSFVNAGGTKALGVQGGFEARARTWLDLFANYSYQSLKDDNPDVVAHALNAPKHKVNAGVRTRRRGLTTSLWADWVSATYWNINQTGSANVYGKVPDYLLLNGRVGYAFAGKWDGLELAVSAFNLADKRHYEIAPPSSPVLPGQNGEIVRSRWLGTISYRF